MIQIVLLSGFRERKRQRRCSVCWIQQGSKIGVMIKEFGEINIDAKLVSREGIDIAELSNESSFAPA